MYPGWITDIIVDILWGIYTAVFGAFVAIFVFGFFYVITLGIMSIVYLLN